MKQKFNPDFLADVNVNEFKPLFVASRKIEKVIFGPSKKTWSNWRSLKMGPRFFMVHGSVYYKISDLEEYFSQNPVLTFNPE